MRCPKCSYPKSKVNDSRTTNDVYHTDSKLGRQLGAVRRRRECVACGYLWTTYEINDDHLERFQYVQLDYQI